MKKVRKGAVKGSAIAGLVLVMMFLMAGITLFASRVAVAEQVTCTTMVTGGLVAEETGQLLVLLTA